MTELLKVNRIRQQYGDIKHNEVRLNSGDYSVINGKQGRNHIALFNDYMAKDDVPAGMQLPALQSHS